MTMPYTPTTTDPNAPGIGSADKITGGPAVKTPKATRNPAGATKAKALTGGNPVPPSQRIAPWGGRNDIETAPGTTVLFVSPLSAVHAHPGAANRTGGGIPTPPPR